MLNIGEKAPDFCLEDPNRGEVCLRDYLDKWVILYFYPRDNTRGCTREALDFTAVREEFEKRNAVVMGVSPDSLKSHARFREKHGLTINLLSDPEKEVLKAYGVWQKKKRYGREYMGVVRTTYIIDPNKTIAYVWPKVRVAGHVDQVLEKLKEIQWETT